MSSGAVRTPVGRGLQKKWHAALLGHTLAIASTLDKRRPSEFRPAGRPPGTAG
jgi:hypothetical protein